MHLQSAARFQYDYTIFQSTTMNTVRILESSFLLRVLMSFFRDLVVTFYLPPRAKSEALQAANFILL